MRARSSPSTTTRPSSARSSPPRRFRSVVFPEPEGPMTASHSPCLISRLTRSRAITPLGWRRVALSITMKDMRRLLRSLSPKRRGRLDGKGPPQRDEHGDEADQDRRAHHDRHDRQARLDGGAEQTATDEPREPRPERDPCDGPENPHEPHLAQEHPEDLAVTGAHR